MRAQADEAAIVAAVKEAEAKTSGQIVCVLARQSCETGAAAALYAATLALLSPWPLLAGTQLPAQHIFAIQLGLFLVALSLLSWTPLGLLLMPRHEQRRQAFRSAVEQFFVRGLSKTHSRAGVLIFVSLAERYARILADDGLTDKVSEKEWQGVVDELTGHLREGRITEGFVAAIVRSGDLLAGAAPPDGGSNDLPDGLVRLS
jgi:putative membrane protein